MTSRPDNNLLKQQHCPNSSINNQSQITAGAAGAAGRLPCPPPLPTSLSTSPPSSRQGTHGDPSYAHD